MRRTAIVAVLVASAAVLFAGPANAIPPPPYVLCANDFSTANLTGWQKSGGRWTVTDGEYRQTRLSGSAVSWYQEEYWSHSATARVKLVAAAGPRSFVAFNVAVRGATTSYRLALFASGVAQLQAVDAGTVTVLASQALPVTAGTWYSVQLAMSQTTIAALVDGVWLFGGYVNLPAGGHYLGGVGFGTHRAAGAFDDLVVIIYGSSTAPRCPTTPGV